MKTLFDYLYYRTSKFYEDWGEKSGHVGGSVVVFSSFAFVCLSFCVFVFYLFDKKINTDIIWAIIMIFILMSLFFINKKKYAELSEKYKEEQNSKLKGRLVFLYYICSVILYFGSLILCDYWVSIEI